MKKLKNIMAFTLSEVLITLVIIGIIAALTIPTLMTNMEENQSKVAWKKGFSAIATAYNELKQDNGGFLDDYFGAGSGCTNALVNSFINEFNLMKSCVDESDRWCGFPQSYTSSYTVSYKDQLNATLSSANFNYGNAILADGSTIFFRTFNQNYSVIWLDTNGHTKGPNILGKDLFGAIFTKDWIKPIGAVNAFPTATCGAISVTCSASYGFDSSSTCAGAGCSSLYLMQ